MFFYIQQLYVKVSPHGTFAQESRGIHLGAMKAMV